MLIFQIPRGNILAIYIPTGGKEFTPYSRPLFRVNWEPMADKEKRFIGQKWLRTAEWLRICRAMVWKMLFAVKKCILILHCLHFMVRKSISDINFFANIFVLFYSLRFCAQEIKFLINNAFERHFSPTLDFGGGKQWKKNDVKDMYWLWNRFRHRFHGLCDAYDRLSTSDPTLTTHRTQ